MSRGHDGTLTVMYARSPRDALSRLELLITLGGSNSPVQAIRQLIASTIQIIVQQELLRDSSRKVTFVTEILGMENGEINTQDIFRFEESGVNDSGRIVGLLKPTGVVPQSAVRIKEAGVHLSEDIFPS